MSETSLPDGGARASVRQYAPDTMTPDELRLVDAYWRAANYLSVGQIYLLDNPLLKEPLAPEHVKPRLLGHWGTTPGLNLVYAHMNRVIRARDLNAIYICGPGHGGPGMVANAYLEGTYSELYAGIREDEEGLRRLFRQFSFPGGIPSHAAPETPGSIHEGGELGYALAHAFGAVFDNPDLLAVCVVGDGEAETGPLATSWHANKFVNPQRDGAVLPILHLNGYKIANPTVLARIPERELFALFEGYGYHPILVAGDEPDPVHDALAAALDESLDRLAAIRAGERAAVADDHPAHAEGLDRACRGRRRAGRRDVALPPGAARRDAHERRAPRAARSVAQELPPRGAVRRARSAPPRATCARPRGRPPDEREPARERRAAPARPRPARLPRLRRRCRPSRAGSSEAMRVLGAFVAEVVRANPETFRVFGPDETASNRLGDVFSATDRQWEAAILPTDEHLAPEGRVVEILSEHLCQGWLEGYLLTGRHGVFNCYEAFIHIIDAMFNQHAKWLKVTAGIPWRRPIASLNYLLSSHVWRQDHNGFSHQDPGFIDHVVNKKAEVVRVYLPPDANTLLSRR